MRKFIIVLCLIFVKVNADVYDEVKNSRNFTGKVVLVTGSTSGIGEATVKLFSSLGAKVVVTGRNETNLKRVGEEVTKLSPHNFKVYFFQSNFSRYYTKAENL
jgi:NAD(P)-dependent dehydrogenase (short-subunit alcohol dehydrogenase family)